MPPILPARAPRSGDTNIGALQAILSVGRVAERPFVRDGNMTTAPISYVSVAFDHRVVDGARAAEFGLTVIRRLENRKPAEAVCP